MAEHLKLATISLCAKSNKAANVDAALSMVRRAAASGAEWVLLPEIFAWHGPYAQIYEQAEFEDGPLNQRLSALAAELKIVLFAGSVGERPGVGDVEEADQFNSSGERRVFNTSYVFGRDGSLLAKYRKTHLFNLANQSGDRLYCEPEGFIPGSGDTILHVDGFRCAIAICYDLRFPGFFQAFLRKGPVDILVIPSAFTRKTGEAHWELLLRARAVELQCYVFAANQTGEHAPGKESYGHSMIVDPWGIKLCDTGVDPGFVTGSVSLERIEEVRRQLPVLQNRRPDLYQVPR
jgi:predicted amidohydrolase